MKIAIIGGGAAGFFAALSVSEAAKKLNKKTQVTIFEASSSYLKKVKISGGGRCNVTHNQFNPKLLVQNYPRGSKELLSAFSQFQPQDTVEWFKSRGVEIVSESDGRMFPQSNNSQTIIDCFFEEAKRLGVQYLTDHAVVSLVKKQQTFTIEFKNQKQQEFDRVLVATGSSPGGYRIVESLGHSITDRAPSLFTFKIKSPFIKDLLGTSFQQTHLKLTPRGGKTYKQTGPLLITHWGLSGPAVLKLSAWAAREMKAADYQARLVVNFSPFEKLEELSSYLLSLKNEKQKMQIQNLTPEFLTKRFWVSFLEVLGIQLDRVNSEISKKQWNQIQQNLFACELEIKGQSRFKEEFVECGGVSLKEINFKTFESKVCPGLYIAGELLDVDGITGGFNFQNAWTGGFIAGQNMLGESH